MAAVGKVLALYNHQAVLGPYRTSPVTRHEKLIGSLLQAELSAMLARYQCRDSSVSRAGHSDR